MLSAFGLYTHIQANRRRSAALVAGLILLFLLMTYAVGLLLVAFADEGSAPLSELFSDAAVLALVMSPFSLLAALLWIWIASRYNAQILGFVTGAREAGREAEPELHRLLENLCMSRGMRPPRLRIIETQAMNAFASGMKPEQYTITLTRGLIETLDRREIEAVIAHELTHIRNDDVRTMMIAVLMVGIMSLLGEMAWRGLARGGVRVAARGSARGGKGRGLVILFALGLLIVAWLMSVLIRYALSRSREYLADAGAVELTKDADAMISALRKIEGRGELERAPSAVMELCLDNPRQGFSDLFATHPSIERRIEALERYAGGRDLASPQTTPPEA